MTTRTDRSSGGGTRRGAEPRWLSPEEERAWRSLLLVHAHLTGVLARQLAEHDLALHDYGVLVLLDESEAGERRPYELGELLGVEKTRLSHLLSRLESRGLVVRRRCPTDRRGRVVAITPAGRRKLEEAAPGHVEAVREAFIDRLAPRHLRALAEVAEAVLPERIRPPG